MKLSKKQKRQKLYNHIFIAVAVLSVYYWLYQFVITVTDLLFLYAGVLSLTIGLMFLINNENLNNV